jgi:hypothetical protein
MDLEVGDRHPDRAPSARAQVRRRDRPVGDVDRGLGDAVHVDQPRPPVAVPLDPGGEHRRIERLASEDDQAQPQVVLRRRGVRPNQLPEG